MATKASVLWGSVGGSSGPVIGQIVAGNFANDANYLPCDGSIYTSASYPLLDKTGLDTWGNNTPVIRILPAVGGGVAFGNGMFVSVSLTAAAIPQRSTDGVSWTATTMPSITATYIGFINGKFVIVAGSTCYYSTDGITWNSSSIGGSVYHIAFGNGLYIAGHSNNMSGSQNQYFTSPDLATWTTRNTASETQSGPFVTFLDGKFYSSGQRVGSTLYYSNQYISTSVDGINWTERSLVTGDSLRAADDFVQSPAVAGGSFNSPIYSFKNRWSLSSASARYVSTDGGNTWQGTSHVMTGNYGHMPVVNNIQFAPITTSSGDNKLAYSYDGNTWRSIVFSAVKTTFGWGCGNIYGINCSITFGNNRYVIVSAGSSQYATLDNDTTKFRTPVLQPTQDGERYYIKAA
jgi:hypothetical protein